MIETVFSILTMVTAIGSGLMGGFFFAFSICVMAALGRLTPPHGIAAMQAINVVVLNPVFFLGFFGTGVAFVILAATALVVAEGKVRLLVIGAAAVYLIGCIGVTVVINVPLNNRLARAEPATLQAASLWAGYLDRWTAWNHVRAVAPLISALMLAATLG